MRIPCGLYVVELYPGLKDVWKPSWLSVGTCMAGKDDHFSSVGWPKLCRGMHMALSYVAEALHASSKKVYAL